MSLLISVVVCTYNRSDVLTIALDTLANQTLDRSLYEIIVVDNNSTDSTRAVFEDYSHLENIRYILETSQGLSHARNRGWKEAKGEYIAYFDDDCKIPEEWLTVAKDVIEQVSPDVFGGPYFPFYLTKKPRWIKSNYFSNYQGDEAGILDNKKYLSGTNICFRRTLFKRLGGFDAKLGMSGKNIAYGEEVELVNRISNDPDNYKIYYDPRLYVYHLVREEKMKMFWIIRQRFVMGRSTYRVVHSNNPLKPTRSEILKDVLKTTKELIKDLLRCVLKRDRIQYPYFQNYLFEHSFTHIKRLGRLYEEYRQVSRE